MEAQFATQGIITRGQCSSTSWYYYPLTQQACDLILTPPAENQYTILKEQLIQHTATSQQQRIQQLLTAEELGDRKPTQFLHYLQQLAGDMVRQDSIFI